MPFRSSIRCDARVLIIALALAIPAGVLADVGPLFRHTMATLMLEGGADIRFIQAMLGHSSLEATQVYTRVAIRKLKEVHELSHPGANPRQPRSREEKSDGEELRSTLAAEAEEDLDP